MDKEAKYILTVEEPESGISKWEVFKNVSAMAASGCATMVVNRYLRANMPAGGNIVEKAVLGAGVYFITGVVGAKVAEYCEDELEQIKGIASIGKKNAEVEDERN